MLSETAIPTTFIGRLSARFVRPGERPSVRKFSSTDYVYSDVESGTTRDPQAALTSGEEREQMNLFESQWISTEIGKIRSSLTFSVLSYSVSKRFRNPLPTYIHTYFSLPFRDSLHRVTSSPSPPRLGILSVPLIFSPPFSRQGGGGKGRE